MRRVPKLTLPDRKRDEGYDGLSENMIETKIAHPLAGANSESVLEQTFLKIFF